MPDLAPARRSLVDEGTAELRAAGIAQPRREAVQLWAEVTGEDRASLFLQPDATPRGDAGPRFQAAIRRRARGEPLAHITGRIAFRHLTLRSDRRALMPRPETEGLVDLVLSRVRTGRVADIGTGSGCIALSLAREGEFAQVVAVDLSPDALALARENRHALGARVDLALGDLCTPLGPCAFDALVSNPPYLSAAEYDALDPSVQAWEPRVALVSGSDGLEATTRLLQAAGSVLRPGGWMVLEVDAARARECARRAGELGWTEIAVQADLFGRERYLLARRSETA